MNLYKSLAADLEASIRAGTLRTGDRLPSIRDMATNRGVSATTVFEAYYQLERLGLVQARTRSGFYVKSSRLDEPRRFEQVDLACGKGAAQEYRALTFEVLASTLDSRIVSFASSSPCIELFPWVRLDKAFRFHRVHLDPAKGNADLRRQVSQRYFANGVHVHMDDIVITDGAWEALSLCLSAVARLGDCVLVESPTFHGALHAIERQGLRAIAVKTHPDEGIELPALREAILRHKPAACWLMTSFQNPLGCSMSHDRKSALVSLLAEYSLPLIEDDVYGELSFDGLKPAPALAFDKQGMVLHCSSFSKCLVPGHRIGWAVPGRYMRAVTNARMASGSLAPSPAQAAIAEYLERGEFDRHLRTLRAKLREQYGLLAASVARHLKSVAWANPAGGYYMWVELAPHINAVEIFRRALALGVGIAPGPIFSSNGEFANCLRLSFGHPWDVRSEQAIATLGRLIASAGGQVMHSDDPVLTSTVAPKERHTPRTQEGFPLTQAISYFGQAATPLQNE
ncbi:PLP-dependent aminotransferase family protein [Variovorax sp. GT1P44]|uniref:aminotransferase-like domain-containing protein n=1 Tax=Variovorax sp. GT1P44 TaxID=3443742 RepID=UPI003F47E484